jgi:hypothetical protein
MVGIAIVVATAMATIPELSCGLLGGVEAGRVAQLSFGLPRHSAQSRASRTQAINR